MTPEENLPPDSNDSIGFTTLVGIGCVDYRRGKTNNYRSRIFYLQLLLSINNNQIKFLIATNIYVYTYTYTYTYYIYLYLYLYVLHLYKLTRRAKPDHNGGHYTSIKSIPQLGRLPFARLICITLKIVLLLSGLVPLK